MFLSVRLLSGFLVSAVDQLRDRFVDPEGDEADDQSLKDIEREECPEDETCLVCDQRIYRRAHSDDRLCGEVQNRTVQRQSDEVVERYCDDAEHKCREKH